MDKEWYQATKDLDTQGCWNELYKRHSEKLDREGRSVWLVNDEIERYSGWLEKNLYILFDDLNIKSFVDVGCSDVVWQAKINWNGIDYIGLDIVKKIIDDNKVKYPDLKFKHSNLIVDPCPTADMIFVRNVFLHTSLDDIKKILTNIKKSGSKYLLVSTDITIDKNEDTSCIWAVRRNMGAPPLNIKKPIAIIPEILPSRRKKWKSPNNYMALYTVDNIPDYEV